MKRLLIATDGSATGRAAVDEGLELARELNARVLFVYVKPRPLGVLGEPFYQRRLTREVADAQVATDEAMRAAQTWEVESDWEILEGEAAVEIVASATERDADLIVVGSRGHGTGGGALLEASPAPFFITLTGLSSSPECGRPSTGFSSSLLEHLARLRRCRGAFRGGARVFRSRARSAGSGGGESH